MEQVLILERKSLTDLITTLTQYRSRFFEGCQKMTHYRWRALLVEASYEDIKSVYGEELNTRPHPNAVSGTVHKTIDNYSKAVLRYHGTSPSTSAEQFC